MNDATATSRSNAAAGTGAPAVDPTATRLAGEFVHTSPLIACRFDPTGTYAFASSEDNSVQRWAVADGKQASLKAHDSWVRTIAFTPDGQVVLTGGSDGRLIWWPVAGEAPQPIRTLEAHRGWIRAAAVSPDGTQVATGGNDRVVRIWNTADGSPVRELPGHELDVYSVQYHPTGQFLLTGDLMGKVHQWNTADGTLVRTFDAAELHSYNGGQGVHFGGVRTIAFRHDTAAVAFGGLFNASNPLGAVHDPLVLAYDWDSLQKQHTHGAGDLKGVAWRVVSHPAGYWIAASGGTGGGWLLFWKTDNDQLLHKFQLPNIVRDLDIHPDGVRLLTAHHDMRCRVSTMAPA